MCIEKQIPIPKPDQGPDLCNIIFSKGQSRRKGMMVISQDAPCMHFYRDTIAQNVKRANSHVLQQSPQTMYELSANNFVPPTRPSKTELSANNFVSPLRPSTNELSANNFVPPTRPSTNEVNANEFVPPYNPHNLNNALLIAEKKK